jgi:nucleoid-associated protein YgaU
MRYVTIIALLLACMLGCQNGPKHEVQTGPAAQSPSEKPPLNGPRPLDTGPREESGEFRGETPPTLTQSGVSDMTAAQPSEQEKPIGRVTYVIQQGDTLWKIASQELGDGKRWKEITELNPGLEPNSLRVGQEIIIPKQ